MGQLQLSMELKKTEEEMEDTNKEADHEDNDSIITMIGSGLSNKDDCSEKNGEEDFGSFRNLFVGNGKTPARVEKEKRIDCLPSNKRRLSLPVMGTGEDWEEDRDSVEAGKRLVQRWLDKEFPVKDLEGRFSRRCVSLRGGKGQRR